MHTKVFYDKYSNKLMYVAYVVRSNIRSNGVLLRGLWSLLREIESVR